MPRLQLGLVDGNYMLHRALHTTVYQEMKTSAGVHTGGVLGTFMMLRNSIQKHGFTRVIMVWDGVHSVRRQKILPGYKVRDGGKTTKQRVLYESHRKMFMEQEKWVWQLLPLMGVWQVRLANREGDDVIRVMTETITGADVYVVSDDKDMLQLVTPKVSVCRPMKGDVVTYDNFHEMFGVGRCIQLLRLIATGDAVDCIPGAAGERTVNRVMAILDAILRAEGVDVMTLPTHDGEWSGLFGRVIEVCELLASFDVRNRRHYERLADACRGSGVMQRNVNLIDLRREEFSVREKGLLADYTSEESTTSAVVTAPASDVMKMLQHFHIMEAAKATEHWGSTIEPLRYLT